MQHVIWNILKEDKIFKYFNNFTCKYLNAIQVYISYNVVFFNFLFNLCFCSYTGQKFWDLERENKDFISLYPRPVSIFSFFPWRLLHHRVRKVYIAFRSHLK